MDKQKSISVKQLSAAKEENATVIKLDQSSTETYEYDGRSDNNQLEAFFLQERPFKCVRCFRNFQSKIAFKRHMITYTKRPPFQCDICKTQFSDQFGFSLHSCTNFEAKPFKCSLCGYSFALEEALNCHVKLHCF